LDRTESDNLLKVVEHLITSSGEREVCDFVDTGP
jgi:hypothetical protein